MIALPFVYFLIWLLYSLRRRGLDVYTYILTLYTAISFCSILLDAEKLYSDDCLHLELGFFAPILYCLLLTICIVPFSKIRSPLPVNTRINDRFLTFVVYAYFVIFLIVLVTAFSRINEIIVNNAFDQVRRDAYSGDNESFYNHLSGIQRYIAGIAGELATSAYFLIFIFFYNLAFNKKSIIFNVITLLSSCPQLICSINQADRSQFFYWIIMVGLAYTIFHKYLSKSAKKRVLLVLLAFGAIFLAYLLAVSVARFSYRDDNTSGGIINYAGQSYINFCNFINYLHPNYHSLCELFPITHTYILDEPNYFESCEIIRKETNIVIYGFSTFLGFIYSISGGIVLLLFVLLYFYITTVSLPKKRGSFYYFIKIWCLSLVVVLGIFTHFYSFPNTIFALFIWLFVGHKATRFNKITSKTPVTNKSVE